MQDIISEGGTAIADHAELDQVSSKLYLVNIQSGTGEYEGVFCSPFPSKRFSEVLAGMGDFISLKDVTDMSTKETFPCIFIGKSQISTVKVLEER